MKSLEWDDTPAEAYEASYRDIWQLLAKIQHTIVTDHDNNQPKTWADVGDQGNILEELWQIDTFLRLR